MAAREKDRTPTIRELVKVGIPACAGIPANPASQLRPEGREIGCVPAASAQPNDPRTLLGRLPERRSASPGRSSPSCTGRIASSRPPGFLPDISRFSPGFLSSQVSSLFSAARSTNLSTFGRRMCRKDRWGRISVTALSRENPGRMFPGARPAIQASPTGTSNRLVSSSRSFTRRRGRGGTGNPRVRRMRPASCRVRDDPRERPELCEGLLLNAPHRANGWCPRTSTRPEASDGGSRTRQASRPSTEGSERERFGVGEDGHVRPRRVRCESQPGIARRVLTRTGTW